MKRLCGCRYSVSKGTWRAFGVRQVGKGTTSVAVLQTFAAGMFEGWTRLPVSDRYRVVVVTLAVPCAVALALAVRPAQRQPGKLFLGLQDPEVAVEAHWESWGVSQSLEDGRYTEVVPAVRRAEVIVE